jgi:hypothetical protein
MSSTAGHLRERGPLRRRRDRGHAGSMSSLASQAHAAAATTLTPSAIAFYATAATIVPVLFIALAVQGTAYQNMLRAPSPRPRIISPGNRPSGGCSG